MKKIVGLFVSCVLLAGLTACQRSGGETAVSGQPETEVPSGPVSSQLPDGTAGTGNTGRRISVHFGENTVVYELNDSAELDTDGSPLAEGGAGTLAYYAPWGDVVMFYGDYSANPSLFELGQAVSGGELVGRMSGTVTIEKVE